MGLGSREFSCVHLRNRLPQKAMKRTTCLSASSRTNCRSGPVLASSRYRAASYNAAADPIHAPVEAQPACLQGEMREYQVEGLRWMVSRLGDSGVNAILADEMVLAY